MSKINAIIKQSLCRHKWFTMICPVSLQYKNHYCIECGKIKIAAKS